MYPPFANKLLRQKQEAKQKIFNPQDNLLLFHQSKRSTVF